MTNQETSFPGSSAVPLAPTSTFRPRAGLIFLLLVCTLSAAVFPAAGVIRDGGVDPANLGKGEWLYVMSSVTNKLLHGVNEVTNENSLMLYLKNQGIRWVIVKAGDGGDLYKGTYSAPQFNSNLVYTAHANGLFIFGDTRSFGTNIPGEIAVANHCFTNGADGFVWDAEQEWETLPQNPGITNGPLQAWWLCSVTRSNWPTKFLAHSPQAIISVHTSFPYREFGYWSDAVMPMVYHFSSGSAGNLKGSRSATLEWMDVNWSYYQRSSWKGSSLMYGTNVYWTNSVKPLQPMFDVYDTHPDREVTEDIDYAAADPDPATTGGYQGVSFFQAYKHSTNEWNNIGPGTSGSFAGQVNNLVLDDVQATGSGSWTKVVTFTFTSISAPSFVGATGSDTNSFGTNYSVKAKGTGSAYMQFNPTIVVPGDYDVYQWHPYRADASASVPHVITCAGGSTTVYANQQTNDGQWSLLGRFNFAAGTSGNIRVTDGIPEAGGVAIVDGLKLVFAASNTVTVTLISSPDPSTYGDAVTLSATVTGSDVTPTGVVTFKDGSTTLGAATLDGSGHAAFSTNHLSAVTSPHSLTAVYGGDSSYYSRTSNVRAQIVNRKGLTVTGLTAQSKTYDGTTNATLTGTPALSGVVSGDNSSLIGTAVGAFTSKTVGTGKTVKVTGLSLSGADAGNYTLTQPTLSADITAAPLTVSGITADNKPYDGTTATSIHTANAALATVVSGDSVTLASAGATGAFADPAVGWGKFVNVTGLSITGNDSGNYSLLLPATATADIWPTTPPRVTSLGYEAGNGTFRMTFAGYPNYRYRIETATAATGPWSFVQTAIAGGDGSFEVVDSRSPGEPARFYRTLYP